MSDTYIQVSDMPLRSGGAIGRVTLDAPTSLNALSFGMAVQLMEQLQRWSSDPHIEAVWLEGRGEKAFCAGGDIVSLYKAMREGQAGPGKMTGDYFTLEYRLDHFIHHYPKPVIVWGAGYVMGGGLGLLAGASHRVVCETTRVAMPEVSIGLYPDVGASWFLNRMPGRCGLFLGVTGAQLTASDGVFVGLADRCITADRRENVLADLQALPHAISHRSISRLLREHEQASRGVMPEPNVQPLFDTIQAMTDVDDDQALLMGIKAYTGDNAWLSKAARTLAQGSPTSAAITLRQLRRSKRWSLAQALRSELDLSVRCTQLGELEEGIRALLIDKDRQPKWHPDPLETDNTAWLDAFFEPAFPEEEHPLRDLKD
ncbi:enoyl-CoA hydratase/carnithine racemase [Pseudomonas duriflava]|uniref:3-hydroxyisobutyryl-CoA hydrolase n=1 Tax=Pseudomonas duriflava TaxID=459528 RepID=A0A562Q784_9PSED|nr:enoyl-CoA hydratase/isomerase family protein [Pseudomonas duriflava]TWI52622.1 enoyl-CoA hydratase/carnithine racemase [Pseudomonas duriflava]